MTVGSVNGDAYPDLVLTRQPTGLGSDVDFPSKGGAVAVALGGPKGQNTSVKPKWITQATAGVPGADERGDAMGASVAVGDLDGDGYGEVVVGLPGEDVGTAKDAGGVLIFKGRATGITGADTKVIGQSTADVPGVDEQGDGFGGEVHVVAGAKNVPATPAVAAPARTPNQGGVWLFKGSRTGPVTKGSISFGEASFGRDAVGGPLRQLAGLREPFPTGHGPRATGHGPRATGHGPRATGHGPRATGVPACLRTFARYAGTSASQGRRSRCAAPVRPVHRLPILGIMTAQSPDPMPRPVPVRRAPRVSRRPRSSGGATTRCGGRRAHRPR